MNRAPHPTMTRRIGTALLITVALVAIGPAGAGGQRLAPADDNPGPPYLPVNINPAGEPPVVNINPPGRPPPLVDVGRVGNVTVGQLPSIRIDTLPPVRVTSTGCADPANFRSRVDTIISGPLVLGYLALEPGTGAALSTGTDEPIPVPTADALLRSVIYLENGQSLVFDRTVFYSGCRP